ncbi:hypothetical protein J5N97_005736 [Dioscorea zingiberensis]|uniref:SAP domain-containing protein n=1 Tax=Dioscorea zingiberensis TaxID=325984 RepID=A0A9D5D8N8_9LILI|nr:hypothetical protein J5N97_005736 [Dioscorea zingiberensis]
MRLSFSVRLSVAEAEAPDRERRAAERKGRREREGILIFARGILGFWRVRFGEVQGYGSTDVIHGNDGHMCKRHEPRSQIQNLGFSFRRRPQTLETEYIVGGCLRSSGFWNLDPFGTFDRIASRFRVTDRFELEAYILLTRRMSSKYPVLDNRPIDQWKVTELKEELRRRGYPLRGLKEELVRRLDEAIREEKGVEANSEEEHSEESNGFDPDSGPQDNCDKVETQELTAEDDAGVAVDKNLKIDSGEATVDAGNSNIDVNQDVEPQGMDEIPITSSTVTVEKMPVSNVSVEASDVAVSQSVITQVDSSIQVTANEKSMDSEPPLEDVKLSVSEENNQVSEVSHLEFQVKCESISTDYVSINEKNEQKDNFNANNFPLELEVVKSEMVQPSSSNCPPIGGYKHPKDVDKEPGESQASLEDIDIKHATDVALSEKNDSTDERAPEKLNLDRSPNDVSVEEDVLDNKHVDSQSVGMEEKTELSELNDIGEQSVVDVMEADSPPGKKTTVIDEKMQPAPVTGKRQSEAVEVKEPVKRQRRWNSETIKVPDIQTPNLISSNTPKESQPTPRRAFTRSDSTLSGGSPKERIVPPSEKPATTSLRIDRFLRPFTLKAVRELLSKTGSVSEFWMDHIKTHCYVTYSSLEEAVATRDAVYNLQWPPNGGRLLVAEFVDPQEVKARIEAPPESPVPVSPNPTTPTTPSFQQARHPQPSHQQGTPRQQLPPAATLPPPPPLSNLPPVREQLPPPPPLQMKPEPPVVTLDDLFKKTKTTPRIYYLPLSEKQLQAEQIVDGDLRDSSLLSPISALSSVPGKLGRLEKQKPSEVGFGHRILRSRDLPFVLLNQMVETIVF